MSFILAIILTIIIYNVYHKMFNVTYFGFSAFIKEIAGIFIFSFILCSTLLGR